MTGILKAELFILIFKLLGIGISFTVSNDSSSKEREIFSSTSGRLVNLSITGSFTTGSGGTSIGGGGSIFGNSSSIDFTTIALFFSGVLTIIMVPRKANRTICTMVDNTGPVICSLISERDILGLATKSSYELDSTSSPISNTLFSLLIITLLLFKTFSFAPFISIITQMKTKVNS